MSRLFTLEEANSVLPRLRPLLEQLRDAVAALERVEAEACDVRWKLRANGHNVHGEPLSRLQSVREAVGRLAQQIADLGVELKDPRSGLIDFPSQREGQIVYLCWKLDEPEVAYWHSIEAGFAGRQRL
jgi:hypothetical protein